VFPGEIGWICRGCCILCEILKIVVMLSPVVVSVLLVLLMCILRVNVVIALTTGALVCGVSGGLSLRDAVATFADGLGGGAKIALSYAILGAFASALAHSGLQKFLMSKVARLLHLRSRKSDGEFEVGASDMPVKAALFLSIGAMAIACKNVIPVHIAFIPILIPPLVGVFNGLRIDRRLVACIMTFGLIVAYMVIPIGFGEIFLVDILSHYLRINGLEMELGDIIGALAVPVIGMAIGLFAAFVNYRKPRIYNCAAMKELENDDAFSKKDFIVSSLAVVAALITQLAAKSIILSALAGFLFLSLGGAVRRKDSDSVVANGFKMMALISFTMLAAAGFGHVLRESGGIEEVVAWLAGNVLHDKVLASFAMLFVGFLISVGIGSSFSTVPIVASVYVPLGLKLEFSPAAIAVMVAVSGVTGDAGSPASDSTLGPTMGLNVDGQHSLVRDTAIPTFLHLTIPAFLFGWLAAIIL
jgi:predicted histidine transporter YuiF (NhaC family)